MRRLALLCLLSLCVIAVKAQNIQMHYDFGSAIYDGTLQSRPKITTTVEMFKPDQWGSTFFFVDMDYTADGVTGGYFEIARALRFWDSPISAHVEYNGGLVRGFSFQNNYLFGASYAYNNEDYSRGFSLIAAYKIIQKNIEPHSAQLTGTWYTHFGRNRMFTFTGFADIWKEKTYVGGGDSDTNEFIFLAEPQFWFNLDKLDSVNDKCKLSIGTELELSHNFGGYDGFRAIPTIGIKWSFD